MFVSLHTSFSSHSVFLTLDEIRLFYILYLVVPYSPYLFPCAPRSHRILSSLVSLHTVLLILVLFYLTLNKFRLSYSLGTKAAEGVAVTETKWIETIIGDLKVAAEQPDDNAPSYLRTGRVLDLEQDYLYAITFVTSGAVEEGSTVNTMVKAVLAHVTSLDNFRPPQAQQFLTRSLIASINLLHAGVLYYAESLEQLEEYLSGKKHSGAPEDGPDVGDKDNGYLQIALDFSSLLSSILSSQVDHGHLWGFGI